jgi:CheY-like chemotaxis protein
MRAAAESMQPLKRWVDDLRQAEQFRPTVLVVDDDEFQHKMVATILAGQPCHVLFATSGIEALEVIGKGVPDLILMDVQMPGMDGVEVMRRLKAVPRFASVPVVMITGKSEGTVVADCLKAGAADFVVKPFDWHTLISKVARWSRPMATHAVRGGT